MHEANTTTFQRDNLGRVTNVVSAGGALSIAIERDVLGRAVHATSSYGLDLSYGYNYQGLLNSISSPAGTVFGVQFDELDRPAYTTNAQGIFTQNSFDGFGRVQYLLDSLGGLLEGNTYSPQGLVERDDALHRPTTFGYDAAGRLLWVTNANTEVNGFTYDGAGDLLSLTDGRLHTKNWTYDIYGRPITERDANGTLVRTSTYDANSRLSSQWTPAKGTIQFSYDNNGNVLTVQGPNSTLSYTYDGLGRLLTMSDPVGNSAFSWTSFGAFDGALGSETGPWGGTLSHTFSGPNLASITLPSFSETITRDGALRPSTLTSPAGAFSYNYNGAGRQLASLSGPGSTTSYTHNSLGELTAIAVANGSTPLDYRGYDYNTLHLVSTAHRLSGNTVNYGYDNIGQLTSATALEPDGSTPRLNETLGYGYDASDNLQSRTSPTLSQSFTSDAADQLLNITRSGTLTVSGSFDGAVATLGVNSTNAAIYSDATFATTTGMALKDGNNLFVTAGSNAAGQLVLSTITSSWLPVAVNLSYDANGNLLGDGQKNYAYDDFNQLSSVWVAGQWKSDFVYDALRRRRIERDWVWHGSWQLTNETRYVCDGLLPIQELNSNNVVQVTYTRGLDLSGTFGGAGGIGGLLARTDGSGSAFYHADLGGNITSLTDSGGNVVARYLYDPFGGLLGKWGSLADANRYRFSSKELHPASGMYYYGYRFFDSNLQRWLNRDPIGEVGGLNLYRFARNNPLMWVDRQGLEGSSAAEAEPERDTEAEAVPELIRPGRIRSPQEQLADSGLEAAREERARLDGLDPEKEYLGPAPGSTPPGPSVSEPKPCPPKTAAEYISIIAEKAEADAAKEETQLHHSDPKFLGGDVKQPLTKLPTPEHQQLHRDLNEFLRNQTDDFGNHMRPQPGNPGARIRENFTRDQRLEALGEFYRQNGSKCPQASQDFFNQHPGLR